VWFDIFLTLQCYRLTIRSSDNTTTELLLLLPVTGLAVSQLAASRLALPQWAAATPIPAGTGISQVNIRAQKIVFGRPDEREEPGRGVRPAVYDVTEPADGPGQGTAELFRRGVSPGAMQRLIP